MHNPLDELAKSFLAFPGIGRRQAKRFVYHLLEATPLEIERLIANVKSLRQEVSQCLTCYRYFLNPQQDQVCDICRSNTRDKSQLLIVEKDADLDNVERAGSYRGRYFVLGGLSAHLPSDPEPELHFAALTAKLKKESEIKEVILALSANSEGDATAANLEQLLLPFQDKIKITVLGRGLSTGTELEYVDPETLKNALKNRS
ncbi:MAG: recombination protein RecR [Candidatus Pacebacteria bacterium]|nr:recombination protein RecR [Candidatus Paceibacterota bacterium]